MLRWLSRSYCSVLQIVVNSSLNVFGVNRRCVAQFSDTPMGDIIMVIIGAAEVGSIQLRAKEGDILKKGQELGLFAYGGSSVVTLFPSGSVDFDADLSSRSLSGIETLVELGTSLGMARARSRVECPQE
jgi:phosphatidylserine decarboxylase